MSYAIDWNVPGKINNDSKAVKILFGGDFCPMRNYEKKILEGKDIFDENLKKTFADNDFCIVNLEAPLCPQNVKADNPSGAGLRLLPETAAFIKKSSIDAVGAANNHLRDFGDAGVLHTIETLKKQEILFAGAGKNIEEAEKILSVNINGLKLGIWVLAEKELNVASETRPGSSWFQPELNALQIRKIKEDYDFLAIYLHAGHEFMLTPSPRIRKSCRAFIDAGADAVIAHHPHVPQGVENYKNGFIAYSLGNLVFDNDYVSSYKYSDVGYMVELGITKHSVNSVRIIPYILGKDYIVRTMNPEELKDFHELMLSISSHLTDEEQFFKEWDTNTARRWDEDYKCIFKTFPERIKNPDTYRNSKNLFTCPTHQEIMEHFFEMLEKRQLKAD